MTPHRGIWLGLVLMLAAVPARAMDLDDVFALLNAGVGEDVILGQMDSESARFLLETEDILALRRSGASDRLLRAMIESGDTRRAERDAAAEEDSSSDSDWTEDYYAPDRDLRVQVTYDPFGYHWYAAPSYFVYYYPFRSWDFGCYYAGWYRSRWWGWNGYWPSYYRSYCDSYYWNHHHRTYYHAQDRYHANHDVRYLSRYDRTADGKAPHVRDRSSVGRDDRVTRSRSPREADISRGRTRSNAPAATTRDRAVERSRDDSRTRAPQVAPPPSSGGRSTPSQPSRPRSSGSSDRSNGNNRGRSR